MAGAPKDVSQESRRGHRRNGRPPLLLAPGCSIDPQTPEANLRALVEAARS
jgi:uroporphyrinogen-III decarboxylase